MTSHFERVAAVMRLPAVFAVCLLSGCVSHGFAPSAQSEAVPYVCLAHPRACGYPSNAPALTRPVHVRITEKDHA